MKYIKLYVLTMLCVAALSAIYLPIYQTSASPSSDVIEITTNPTNSFINFNNMAPGDKISKTLSVINNGNIDFNYFITAIKEKGNQELFDKLLINIIEKDVPLYEGSINELNNIDLGEILSFKKDDLIFSVELPLDAGNEVKKQSTSVAFNFVASGMTKPTESGGGKLPSTATNMFNYSLVGFTLILGGAILFLYHRRKKVDRQ